MRKSALVPFFASASLIASMAMGAVSGPAAADDNGRLFKCRPELQLTVESPTSVKILAVPGPNWWVAGSPEGDGGFEELASGADDVAEGVQTGPVTPEPTATPTPEPTATTTPEPTTGATLEPTPSAQAATAVVGTGVSATRAKSVLPAKPRRWECPNPHILIEGVNETTGKGFREFPATPWEARIAMLPNQTLRVKVTQGPSSVERVVTTPAGVPGPPANLIVTEAGPTSLTVSWTKPKNDSELPITGYEVSVAGKKYEDVTTTSAIVAPLSSDTSYKVLVYAKNAYGRSPAAET